MQVHTKRTEVIMVEIDWLLHQINELDLFRSEESHKITENIQIIQDELFNLSEYVHTHLVETETERILLKNGQHLHLFPVGTSL